MNISTISAPKDLCRATQSYKPLATDLLNQTALAEMIAVRVSGLTGQPCVQHNVQGSQKVCKARAAATLESHLISIFCLA